MWAYLFTRAYERRAPRARALNMGMVAMGFLSLCACGGGQKTSSLIPVSSNEQIESNQQVLASKGTESVLLNLGWSNGQRIPAAFLNTIFGASGLFYQQLPANPTLAANSASVISYYFAGNPEFNAGWIDGNSAQAQYDYNFPVYKASASDPQVKIVCSQIGATCMDNGKLVYLPAAALPAGGSDHRLSVLQPNGLEYDFSGVLSHPPYAGGSTLSVATETNFSLDGSNSGAGYVAPGFVMNGIETGGNALSIGQVYTSELASGVINHAVALSFPCGKGTWTFPASKTGGICGNSQGMPMGSRVWWQPSDSSTTALPIAQDLKTVLIALHHYGGFYVSGFGPITNGQGLGMTALLENQEPYWIYGKGVDPALNYAASAPGWNHIKTSTGIDRYILGATGSTLNLLGNLKVLAPASLPTPTPVPAVSTPTPLVTAAPLSTPTPILSTPTPAPPISGGVSSWIAGQQVPALFAQRAFGASGPFYQQLPATPRLDANSSNVISYYFGGNPQFTVGWIDGNSGQAQYDYSFPIYTATLNDPLVTIVCSHASPAYCVDNGVKIHMPSKAMQAGGSDHHLAVVEPGGLEYDFWLVSSQPPYSNGSSFSAAGEGHFSLSGSAGGTGFVAPGFIVGGATAGGIALSIGQIYTSELAGGNINHAISLVLHCGTSSWVYPATQASGACSNGQGMPLGSRVWWQPSDAQTNAMSLTHDMKTVLIALHHYGGFYTDNAGGSNGSGSSMQAHLENQEAYWLYGGGIDPARNYAASAGWVHIQNSTTDRYILAGDGGAMNIVNNLKLLAPCVTQLSC